MRADWRAVTLDSVCTRMTVGHVGPMVDEYVPEGIPFLRSQNIKPFQIDLEGVKFIPEDFNRRLKKSALRPGDLTVIRTGYPGTAAVVPDSLTEANCADLVVITPGPTADPFFLAALFNSTWGVSAVGGRLVGSAQQHFNVAAARSLEVLLPPLRTQRKIAAILSAYEDLIENNARRIKILEEMAQRVYREWFVDFRYPGHDRHQTAESELGLIPQAWETASLGEVCDRITDGAHRSPPSTPTGLPMASVKDMSTRGLNIAGCRRISPEDFAELARQHCRPKVGDVLIAKDGSYLKHVFPVEEDQAVVILSSIALLRPNTRIRPSILALYLQQPEVRDRLKGYVSGVAIPRIVLKDFRGFRIVVPPMEVQKRFETVARSTLQLAVSLDKTGERLRAARDLLLPRLISGEIDVDDLDIQVPEAA